MSKGAPEIAYFVWLATRPGWYESGWQNFGHGRLLWAWSRVRTKYSTYVLGGQGGLAGLSVFAGCTGQGTRKVELTRRLKSHDGNPDSLSHFAMTATRRRLKRVHIAAIFSEQVSDTSIRQLLAW